MAKTFLCIMKQVQYIAWKKRCWVPVDHINILAGLYIPIFRWGGGREVQLGKIWTPSIKARSGEEIPWISYFLWITLQLYRRSISFCRCSGKSKRSKSVPGNNPLCSLIIYCGGSMPIIFTTAISDIYAIVNNRLRRSNDYGWTLEIQQNSLLVDMLTFHLPHVNKT